LAPGWIRGFSE